MTQLDLGHARHKLLHPELAGDHHEGAVSADGAPLQHAEGLSRPLRTIAREPQPRGAHEHGHHRIDQAEAAARFGLVNELVEPGDALTRALALADRVTANAPVAVQESREVSSRAFGLPEETLWSLSAAAGQRDAADRRNGLA